MAQTSWPFHDGTSGTPVLEDQWSKMARTWSQSGVVSYGNNLGPYSDSDGRQVKVPTGRAIVRGHYYENTSPTVVLAIAANASGNPRIDRVVLRLDPSANSVTLAVLQGTPAGSPSAPALTQTDVGVFEISLARVTVANGATNIVPADVIDERFFIGPPLPLLGGTMTGALTLSGAPTSALHAATKQYVDDKGTWQDWTPTLSGASGTASGRYTRIGNTIHWQVSLTITGGSGSIYFTMPVNIKNTSSVGVIGDWGIGLSQSLSSSSVLDSGPVYPSQVGWDKAELRPISQDGTTAYTTPLTVSQSGNVTIHASGTYEAA